MSVLGGNPLLIAGDDSYKISRSVRLRSSASAYFNRTFGSPTSRTAWTWSGWVKGYFATGSANKILFASTLNTTTHDGTYLCIDNTGVLRLINYLNADATPPDTHVASSAVYRDPSAWYHIMAVWDTAQATTSNRVKFYVNGSLLTSLSVATYPNQNTLSYANQSGVVHTIGAINQDSTLQQYLDGYLAEVNFIDGQALTPSSFGQNDPITGVWGPKKYAGTYGNNGFYLQFSDNSSTITLGKDAAAASGSATSSVYNALGTDGTGWQGMGVRQLIPASAIQFSGLGTKVRLTVKAGSQGAVLTAMKIGKRASSGNAWDFDGNQVSVTFSGSASLTLGANASATSDWITFPLTSASDLICATIFSTGGPYGLARDEGVSGYTNYTKASGTDGVDTAPSGYSGVAGRVGLFQRIEIDGNHWTPNNISLTAGVTYDSMIDTPTPYADGGNGRGNYCVLNPINTATTLSGGNLDIASLANNYVFASMQVTSGKWYWEYTITGSGNYNYFFGVANSDASFYVGMGMCNGGNSPNSFNILTNTNGTVTSPTGSRPAQPATIGIKLDIGAGSVEFYINGTLNGSVTGITNWPSGNYWTPWLSNYTSTFAYQAVSANFGQRPFAQTQPTGFKALNTQNLPDSTIKAGNKYFDVSTWTGDAATPRAVVSNLQFSPDFVWIKDRNTGYQHSLQDTVRGTGASKKLYSSLSEAENGANSVYGHINSFDANGFTVATGSSGAQHVNASGVTYVGWQWKKGATPGFDVVTYSAGSAGQAINHSLGVKPAMMIAKGRNGESSWAVYHKALGATNWLLLNATQGTTVSSQEWSNTEPTSTQFTVGATNANSNYAGGTFVAYLFAEVAGFSKFGSYTGNGVADGPFVYCGFRPRYVLMKSSSIAGSNWRVFDTARDTVNVMNNKLSPNDATGDYTDASTKIDFLSNGFKLRGNAGDMNSSGTYIFAAFAENPFKNALAR